MVPFLGQGMNAAFEDCTVLHRCLTEQAPDWQAAFESYERQRKQHTDALADLAVYNFVEMRDLVGSRLFLLRKSWGILLHKLLGGWYVPLYTLVSFTRTPYADAVRRAAAGSSGARRPGRAVSASPHRALVVAAMTLTYSSYLHLDELLALQQPQSSPVEHDEMLFIVIHQVHELWFKLLLHELEQLQRDFRAGDLYDSIATCKRARTIMKTLVGQVDILETLTPLSFNSFRARLETSSGFQSVQFRELEFLLGYKRPELLKYHEGDPAARERLQQPPASSLALRRLLRLPGAAWGVDPAAAARRVVSEPTRPDDILQVGLLHLYKNRATCKSCLN